MGTNLPAIALWGAGDHATRNILPAINAAKTLRLAGIHTRNAEVLEAQTAHWQCHGWASADEMLADEGVDIVYVATPIGLHATHAARVLESGKHLFCEKSLTTTLTDAETLVEMARSRALALCTTFGPIHHPQFTALRRLIEDGKIGKVVSLTARFGFPHLEPGNARYSAALGGGVLLDAGVYPICLSAEILGALPDFVSARRQSADGYEVDTSGTAMLEFPSGAVANLEWGYGRHYRNEVEVWGETGSIFAHRAFSKPPDLTTELIVRKQDGENTVEIPAADIFVTMLDAQVNCLDDPARREAYWTRALDHQRLVEQVIEASS